MSCIVANKKGFVVGSNKGGFIGIYEIEQKDSSVNHLDTFKIDPKCTSVCGLGTSSDKSRLIISALLSEPCPPGGTYFNSESNMDRVELYSLNMQQLSVSKNIFSIPIKQVFEKGNSVNGLIDIDVGVSKDLIVAAGQDNNIRIFEYSGSTGAHVDQTKSKYQQLSSSLSKEPIYCIAMHPMGLQLVAGFSERYRIYYLLEGEVREAVDF